MALKAGLRQTPRPSGRPPTSGSGTGRAGRRSARAAGGAAAGADAADRPEDAAGLRRHRSAGAAQGSEGLPAQAGRPDPAGRAASLVDPFRPDAPDGTKSEGILFETLPGAQVVAPHDGQVVFRGPFRSYGELLIIEHRDGYHTLLAGLGRTDVVVGQWVLAGEPVGVMEY